MQRKFLGGSWMLLAAIALVFAVAIPASAADDPGKAVFAANKCETCHSVKAEGITQKMASSKAPDLSALGKEVTADFVAKFLKKQVDLDGKKHMKEFTGKDEDLQALAKWVESMNKKK